MQFLQYIYTSCKKGQSPGAGFQVYALSEGLSLSEQQELERLGAYVPPMNLSGRPSPEEISRQFPINFQFFRLQSGRTGLLQSLYKGQDYSGRFGNYFCHALILAEGDWTAYPIQFWQHPAFKSGLSLAEEQVSMPPEPLPRLDLVPAHSQAECFERSAVWIRQKPEYLSHFQYMLNLIRTASRQLILPGDTLEAVNWISLLQLSFPLHLALDITFSTYQLDPERSRSLLTATPREGGRLVLSGRSTLAGATGPWINDLEQRLPEPVSQSRFGVYADQAIQAEQYQELEAIHQLAGQIGLQQRENLEVLALIFEAFLSPLLILAAQWQSTPVAHWSEALQWLQHEDAPNALRDIVKQAVLQKPEQHLQSWEAQKCLQNKALSGNWALYLWSVWRLNADKASQNLLQKLGQQAFLSGEISWLRQMLEVWKRQDPQARETLRAWLMQTGLHALVQVCLSEKSASSESAVLFDLSDFLREWPLYLALGELQEHDVLSAIISSDTNWKHNLLQKLCQSPEKLLTFLKERPGTAFEIWLSQLLPLVSQSAEKGFNLFQRIYQQHPELVWAYLQKNYTGSEHALYFRSLRAWLKAHHQPVQFFEAQQSWLSQNPDLQSDLKTLKEDLMALAEKMSEPQLFALLQMAMTQANWSESERTNILTLYNRCFSFATKDPETLKHLENVLLLRQKHFKNWQTQPDRLTLFAYLQALQTQETAQQVLPRLMRPEQAFPWQGLSAKDYLFFLVQIWSVLLRPAQLWSVLPAYYHPEHEAIFWEQLQVFQDRVKPDSKGFPPNWKSLCWLYLQNPLPETQFKQGLYQFLERQFSQHPERYQSMLKYAKNQDVPTPQEKKFFSDILIFLEDIEQKMGDLLIPKPGLLGHLKELSSRWFKPKDAPPKKKE